MESERKRIENEVRQILERQSQYSNDAETAALVDLVLEERAKEAAAVANWLCSGPMERQFARDRARELRSQKGTK